MMMKYLFSLAVFLFLVSTSVSSAPVIVTDDNVTLDVQCARGLYTRSDWGCPPGFELDPTDLLYAPRYAEMRGNFLNVDEDTLSVISIPKLTTTEFNETMDESVDGPLDLKWYENTVGSWSIFGAKHECTNRFGERSICFLQNGGAGKEGSGGPAACGQSTGNNLTNAQNPDYQCQTDQPWSGMNYWLGVNDNYDFIVDKFYPTEKKPVNRLCVEMELPENNLVSADPEIIADPSLSQFVNREKLNANLRDMSFHWGSYTAPRRDDAGTTSDEEVGGTYQNGGSHFYHKSTAYGSHPPDRVYAINDNTIVACLGNRPNGVRSGMRMPYAWEPLATIGGSDANGETQGVSYVNHLTRLYFRFQDTNKVTASYPLTLKINKMFMMYEDNDIFAATNTGATISEVMVENGEYADHAFTVYNSAPNDRTYRVDLFNRSNGPMVTSGPMVNDDYQLYEDINANGLFDDGTDVRILPTQIITLTANTDKKFILRQLAEYDGYYGSYDRHGSRMSQASFAIQELHTLRSAGFHTRIWEGDATEQLTQEAFFETTKYPSETSLWNVYKEFNNEKNPSTNPHLLRNTRDYQRAKLKGGW